MLCSKGSGGEGTLKDVAGDVGGELGSSGVCWGRFRGQVACSGSRLGLLEGRQGDWVGRSWGAWLRA